MHAPSKRATAWLLVALAGASGCIDVICLTKLNGYFASVVTGNLVHFGHAFATTDGRSLAGAVVAVGGYAVGVAAATAPLRHTPPGWNGRTAVVASAEAVLLLGFTAGWWACSARPGYGFGLVLLGAAAVASGIQSVITVGAGVRGASTTYLTGSLTELVRRRVVDPHRIADVGGIGRLAGLVVGAVLGTVVLRMAPTWAPVLAAVLVITVITVAVGLTHRAVATAGPSQRR
ncbi:YoaK family protein [Micromonospora sp. LH3U1]|uniref:YoaK family protein n=1 Tax=Micromonospora sp. LH3U1 TaxID=3018339 RepID=UPI002349F759|nr:YoaK family protein [Micromonospora sp. LH3U1]WCN81375.1 YoaK family protein [Micromonospora sp. LH3U1]